MEFITPVVTPTYVLPLTSAQSADEIAERVYRPWRWQEKGAASAQYELHATRKKRTMLCSEFQQAIGRALADPPFRARLLYDPVDTLADYGLDHRDALLIQDHHCITLEDIVWHIAQVGARCWEAQYQSLYNQLNLRTRVPFIQVVAPPNIRHVARSPDDFQSMEA